MEVILQHIFRTVTTAFAIRLFHAVLIFHLSAGIISYVFFIYTHVQALCVVS